jgi:hypothetical protein
LLELKGLEEVNKYLCYSPSSLLAVKLISVESNQDGFSLLLSLLTACSLFRLQLLLKCIYFFEKEQGRPLLILFILILILDSSRVLIQASVSSFLQKEL